MTRLLLLCGLAAWLGCSSTDSGSLAGPGDDFPNSRTAVRTAVSACLDAGSVWRQVDVLGDTLPDAGEAESLMVAPLTPNTAAGGAPKRAAEIEWDSVVVDFSDTAVGLLHVYRFTNDFFVTTGQALTLLYNRAALDSTDDNDTILSLIGRTDLVFSDERYEYTFADSDTNGTLDTGEVTHVKETRFTTTVTSVAGTSEDNFAAAVNIVVFDQVVVGAVAGDTLSSVTLADYDNDGTLYDSTGDANAIRVEVVEKNPDLVGQPHIARRRSMLVLTLTESGAWTTTRLTINNTLRRGGGESLALIGPRADSSFCGGDTAALVFSRRGAANGGIDTLHISFEILLAPEISRYAAHRLVSLEARGGAPALGIESFRLGFVPDAPKKWSAFALKGTLNAAIEFRNNARAGLSGTVDEDSVYVEYFDSWGRTYAGPLESLGAEE